MQKTRKHMRLSCQVSFNRSLSVSNAMGEKSLLAALLLILAQTMCAS